MDPFATGEQEGNRHIVNISSGVVAPEPVVNDLLCAQLIGEHHFRQFVDNRLRSDKVKFFDPLPKLKLQTFGSMLRTKCVKVRGTDIVI